MSAMLFALGGKKRKRQPDLANDPWPPGLTEWRIGYQQPVILLGQSKVIILSGSSNRAGCTINFLCYSLYFFQAQKHVKSA